MLCCLYMALCTLKNPLIDSSICLLDLVSVVAILDLCKLGILSRVTTPTNGGPDI